MAPRWVVQLDPESERPDESDSRLTQEEAMELAHKWKAEYPESVVRILECPPFPSSEECEVFRVLDG